MPFPQQQSRPFTRAGIEWLGPDQQGCYGIFRQGQWIYVGRGDLRQRLLDHFNGDNWRITQEAPTHYVTALSSDPVNLEKALILELNPIANRKVG